MLTANLATGGFGQGIGGFIGVAGGGYGGALYTERGGVTASDCTLAQNSVAGGVGINFNGSATSGPGQGGALYGTSSVLYICRTLCQSNTAMGGNPSWSGPGGSAGGGAVAVSSGNAEVCDSAFLSNVAYAGGGGRNSIGGEAFGGGIDSSGEMRVVNSRLSSNIVSGGGGVWAGRGFGGGISGRGPLSISRCALDANEAQGGGGTVILNSGFLGTNGCGGGIYSSSDLWATNITLVANRAFGGNAYVSSYPPKPGRGAAGQGGGICVTTGAAAIVVHATVFGGVARGGTPANTNQTDRGPAQGGGIAVLGGSATLFNSILASNISGSNCFGIITDAGNNISSDSSCAFTQAGSLVNVDPKLGPFADYGGSTQTMPLLLGSPALDAAAPGACPLIDQRGIARPYGAGCDIGAFESAPPYTIRGHVQGYLSSNGTTISVGAAITSPDRSGFFAVNGLSPGSYTVMPSARDAVFVLSNQVLNVGPDIVNAEFRSYRSNAWTVVGLSNNSMHLVLAGAAGQTYQVLDSTNLTHWFLFTNGLLPSSGILRLDQPLDQKARFFRSPGP